MADAAWTALALGTLTKLLVWPAYHSTDMEVHRNWLAVTHSLPLRAWYRDSTSPWTLDYPPFFAYFSWLLAQPAALVDARMVDVVRGLEYADAPCKMYMRATVLASEAVLAAALYAHARITPASSAQRVLLLGLLLHPGLLFVDHIHFQYNGLLYGVLLWALWAARTHRALLCAVLFASLLNLKHIYLYLAPAFTVYLLRAYIVPAAPAPLAQWRAVLLRMVKLGAATVAPFAASFGPFALDAARRGAAPSEAVQVILARLFPFQRGLIHAYWAPNVWALYTAADRVLQKACPALAAPGAGATASRGIVGDTVFGVLPGVSPAACFWLSLAVMAVYSVRLWRTPTPNSLIMASALCALTAFALGWHVHEKAVLIALVPLTLVAGESYAVYRQLVLLSGIAIVSLFPLLHGARETPIKLAYAGVYVAVVTGTLAKRVLRPMPTNVGAILHWVETQYLYGLIALSALVEVVLPLFRAWRPALLHQYTFLPLLLTSVYCAMGVVWVWGTLSYWYLMGDGGEKVKGL
ncbi:dolichyl-P-Glc:Glc1Man9GlcNAc2-PP-dolichol alpha-1,3-glucosyltransferase [Malassezia sp. CBS 17886]|nr:dolichyl-P-Glc:Glc1Man9GlcNAc2-PP-dolichol alpha-1,3-glucosyltransferase [Malassezia sp. CBS 17886]